MVHRKSIATVMGPRMQKGVHEILLGKDGQQGAMKPPQHTKFRYADLFDCQAVRNKTAATWTEVTPANTNHSSYYKGVQSVIREFLRL